MAVSLKKKIQNYTIDQGATFEKTIGAENSSSAAVTISSGTVAGSVIKTLHTQILSRHLQLLLLVQIVPFR